MQIQVSLSVQLWKQILLDHLLRVKGSWDWNPTSSINSVLLCAGFGVPHALALSLPNQHIH